MTNHLRIRPSFYLFSVFTIEPKSVIVRKGSPAILNCQTNNQTSDILIQWRKGYNTRWIYDYANKPYKLLSNGSLSFPSVETGDENVYFCSAYHRGTRKIIYSKIPAHLTLACKSLHTAKDSIYGNWLCICKPIYSSSTIFCTYFSC